MMKLILLITAGLVIASGARAAGTNDVSILTADDKARLLDLARQTVCWHLGHKTRPNPDAGQFGDNLKQKLGCFVTLNHRVKRLRGCLGTFSREDELYRNVIDRAVAACEDDRFRDDPVTYNELKDIEIEISVLTEPKDLPIESAEDLLAKLRPNIDGVILRTRYGVSTFLPQVWEQLPGKEEFLSHLCLKHRAPADTWKKDWKNIRIQTYQAIAFHEDFYGRRAIGPKGAVAGPKGAQIVSPEKKQLTEGKLEPGTIVTWDSDTVEP